MLLIHLELLDKERRKTFKKLKIFRKSAVLAGGTALSLQIIHRYSFDFDLFLPREIERKDFLRLKETFKIKDVGINTKNQLTVITDRNIGITLVHYDYNPLFQKVITPFLPLYSVKDIAADKAFTIGRRAVWRDYVDLFFIFKKRHINISDLLKLSQKKFKVEFNPKLFLEQLVYFEDIEVTKMVFVKEKYSPTEIQKFLKGEVLKYTRQKLF